MKVNPLIDSPEMAARCREQLTSTHEHAERVGRETMRITENGYANSKGEVIDLPALTRQAVAAKRSIAPDAQLPALTSQRGFETQVYFANYSTLMGAERMVADGRKPLVLNFANGTNVGGGFLYGALAQEENLCRNSNLYPTLLNDEMYTYNQSQPYAKSSDWAILSPGVTVFRDDAGTLLETPWQMDVITCAAPIASAMQAETARSLMRQRIERVLLIAASFGYTNLVLGAWGCGAFGNDPISTAADFKTAIEGSFDGYFDHILFAITDWRPNHSMLRTFAGVFGAVL